MEAYNQGIIHNRRGNIMGASNSLGKKRPRISTPTIQHDACKSPPPKKYKPSERNQNSGVEYSSLQQKINSATTRLTNQRRQAGRSSTGLAKPLAGSRKSNSHNTKSGTSELVRRSNHDCCRLGLRRILSNNISGNINYGNGSDNNAIDKTTTPCQPQQETFGPLIRLFPNMDMGRTPPKMLKDLACVKSLKETWTSSDVEAFHRRYPHYRKQFALLEIDRRSVGTYPTNPTTEEAYLQAVSRKLLRVVGNSSNSGIILQRPKGVLTARGAAAKPVAVRVCRKPKALNLGIENQSSSSHNSNSSNEAANNTSSGKYNNIVFDVEHDSRVELREGDTLIILNEKYRYKVVVAEPLAESPQKVRKDTTKPPSSSRSSSGSSGSIHSFFQKRPSPGKTLAASSRTSLSSTNDQTIIFEDGSSSKLQPDTHDFFRKRQSPAQSRSSLASRTSLSSANGTTEALPGSNHKRQSPAKNRSSLVKEIIQIPSSSSSDSEGIPKASVFRAARKRTSLSQSDFRTPDPNTKTISLLEDRVIDLSQKPSSDSETDKAKTNSGSPSKSKTNPTELIDLSQEDSDKSDCQTQQITSSKSSSAKQRTTNETKVFDLSQNSSDSEDEVEVVVNNSTPGKVDGAATSTITIRDGANQYIQVVQKEFLDRPRAFNKFLSLVRELSKEDCDHSNIITSIYDLFREKEHLILGFNKFLPHANSIAIKNNSPANERATPHKPLAPSPVALAMARDPILIGKARAFALSGTPAKAIRKRTKQNRSPVSFSPRIKVEASTSAGGSIPAKVVANNKIETPLSPSPSVHSSTRSPEQEARIKAEARAFALSGTPAKEVRRIKMEESSIPLLNHASPAPHSNEARALSPSGISEKEVPKVKVEQELETQSAHNRDIAKNDADSRNSHSMLSHRSNTRSSRRLARRVLWDESEVPDSQTQAGTPKDDPNNRLRQKGMRIQAVFLQEKNKRGKIIERPIHEVLIKQAKKAKKKANDEREEAIVNGKILSLEEPTGRFWDPLWSSNEKEDAPVEGEPAQTLTSVTATAAVQSSKRADGTGVGESTETVISPSTSESPSTESPSPIPPPNDMPAWIANFCWTALNSSRPREGAWFLNAAIAGDNTTPGPILCKKWMTLLTWGPKLITTSSSSPTKGNAEKRNFSWDGPRMELALDLWKKALRLHPKILLPRMIEEAPGGFSEWWKTCVSYDELSEEERDESYDGGAFEAADVAIRCLRMRSARLEAFLHFLKLNLTLEEEEYKKLQAQQNEKGAPFKQIREENGNESNSEDDFSSDEEEEEDTKDDDSRYLVFLREIRSFGAKQVLRLVAQSMSKFWVSQRSYLSHSGGHNDDNAAALLREVKDPDMWDQYDSLEQERSDVVEAVASQLAEVLLVMRTIMESPFNMALQESTQSHSRRRSTRRRSQLEDANKLSDREIGDILWNAMDLEVRERLPKKQTIRKAKRQSDVYEEPEPREALLVDWIWALQESMGNDFAEELAVKVGVADHYEDLWEL